MVAVDKESKQSSKETVPGFKPGYITNMVIALPLSHTVTTRAAKFELDRDPSD